MTKKITLPWMDMIRERLDECGTYYSDREIVTVNAFISPIIKYGEQQEKLIPELQRNGHKKWVIEFENGNKIISKKSKEKIKGYKEKNERM